MKPKFNVSILNLQREIVARIEKERAIVEGNRESIRFALREEKVIGELWEKEAKVIVCSSCRQIKSMMRFDLR